MGEALDRLKAAADKDPTTYLAGAARALERVAREAPELAEKQAQGLVDALTPDPQANDHWSRDMRRRRGPDGP